MKTIVGAIENVKPGTLKYIVIFNKKWCKRKKKTGAVLFQLKKEPSNIHTSFSPVSNAVKNLRHSVSLFIFL